MMVQVMLVNLNKENNTDLENNMMLRVILYMKDKMKKVIFMARELLYLRKSNLLVNLKKINFMKV